MRSLPTIAVAIVVCAALASSEVQAQSKFTIEIAPSQDALQPGIAVFKKGAPVFFMITMKNDSGRVLHFSLTVPARNYRTSVLDSQGRSAPETEYYREIQRKLQTPFATSRNILVTLKPHQTQSDTIEVSALFDLSLPGKYTVRLERDIPPEIGTGVVASNRVEISIEE